MELNLANLHIKKRTNPKVLLFPATDLSIGCRKEKMSFPGILLKGRRSPSSQDVQIGAKHPVQPIGVLLK